MNMKMLSGVGCSRRNSLRLSFARDGGVWPVIFSALRIAFDCCAGFGELFTRAYVPYCEPQFTPDPSQGNTASAGYSVISVVFGDARSDTTALPGATRSGFTT